MAAAAIATTRLRVARCLDQIGIDIARFLESPPPPAHPQYPGAVALAAHNGVIVAHDAVGYALRYSQQPDSGLRAASTRSGLRAQRVP